MPHLSRITIFPIKSLDGVTLSESAVLPSGALEGDRQFAILDSEGRFVNGKRTASVHLLRTEMDLAGRTVRFPITGRPFQIDSERTACESWLSDYFGAAVTLAEDAQRGFPDDTSAPGPTLISTATLREIAAWFDLELDDVRKRFRTNLEIDGVPPFWEDCLYAEIGGDSVRFQIGGITFEGVNPCQRCVVPSRFPATGEAIAGFVKTFAQRRRDSLPSWAAVSRFDHFYRAAVNLRLVNGAGRSLRAGDAISIC